MTQKTKVLVGIGAALIAAELYARSKWDASLLDMFERPKVRKDVPSKYRDPGG